MLGVRLARISHEHGMVFCSQVSVRCVVSRLDAKRVLVAQTSVSALLVWVFPERRTQIKPAQTEVCATGPGQTYALSARNGTGQRPLLNSGEKFVRAFTREDKSQFCLVGQGFSP
jgi:hypothetical protein